MENIRKKLLLAKLSLEAAIAFRVVAIRSRFGKNEVNSEVFDKVEMIEVVEPTDTDIDFDYKVSGESIIESFDRRMSERVREGRKGINLLFTNVRFLTALVTKRSDVITLILEQYYIENKINEVTIEAFLDSSYVHFTEGENNLLRGLIDTDSKQVVLA